MKLVHRIRALRLKLSADWLLFKVRHAHENRPHVQSHHMIGSPVPEKANGFEITARYVFLILILCFVLGLINGAREEAPSYSCTKSALQKMT
jgi:hypothetical protein